MRIMTLGDVADWGSGGTPKRSIPAYFGEGTPWLSIADLNDGIVDDARESLTSLGLANSAAKVAPVGTLFVAMYGSIGKLGIAGREMCTSQAIACCIPRNEMVDLRYLFHFLLAERKKLQDRGRGGTQLNIGQADLKAWPIPLPEIDEQRRIAAILDRSDTLRAKRRRGLDHFDSLMKSIFREMFGNRQDSEVTVGDVAEIQGGLQITPKRAALPLVAPYLRVANVHRGRLDVREIKSIQLTGTELRRTALKNGDVLFVEGHANPLEVGRAALWDGSVEGVTHQNHLIRARFDQQRILPIFASHWLNSPAGCIHFRRAGRTTSGLNTISASTVRSAPIPLPPIAIQSKFADHVNAVNTQCNILQRALVADDELFTSLQSRAFRGEL